MNLLSALHQGGQTIIMVTHNRENLEWFDRTFYLRDGMIEKDSTRVNGSFSEAV